MLRYRGPSSPSSQSRHLAPWQTVGEAGGSKRRQSSATRAISPETRRAYFAAEAAVAATATMAARNFRRIIGFAWTSFVPQSPFRNFRLPLQKCRINLTRITDPVEFSIYKIYILLFLSRTNSTLFTIHSHTWTIYKPQLVDILFAIIREIIFAYVFP